MLWTPTSYTDSLAPCTLRLNTLESSTTQIRWYIGHLSLQMTEIIAIAIILLETHNMTAAGSREELEDYEHIATQDALADEVS
jgi:hypothetical protein